LDGCPTPSRSRIHFAVWIEVKKQPEGEIIDFTGKPAFLGILKPGNWDYLKVKAGFSKKSDVKLKI